MFCPPVLWVEISTAAARECSRKESRARTEKSFQPSEMFFSAEAQGEMSY